MENNNMKQKNHEKVPRWKHELRNSIRTIDDLKKKVKLTEEEEIKLSEVIRIFPMQITPYYFNLINWKDPKDPLRKMVIPTIDELSREGSLDTSKEREITMLRGVQHKYSPTALFLISDACASYCRFCFRKRLRIGGPTEVIEHQKHLKKALGYLRKHKEIDNVLLTGGDPLMLSDEWLDFILRELRKIKHIKIIRIGTRTPAYLPYRIIEDLKLRKIISKYNKKDKRIYFIVHFNHPRELTKEAITSLKLLIEEGILIKNQTVLLKGINDNPKIIRDLFNKLTYIGVAPYYLFQCRPVRGSKIFQVKLKEGYSIFEEAKKEMSGLAKTARYIMSHSTGKIEIVGIRDDKIYLKYHQAKNPKDIGKFFSLKLKKNALWFDDLTGEFIKDDALE